MSEGYKNLEKQLRILRIAYLSYGIPLTILSILGIIMVYLTINFNYFMQPIPILLIWSAILIAIYLVSGILMILTYFGLKSGIKITRLLGVIGCSMPILSLVIMSFMTGGYHFEIAHLLIWIPSMSILLSTLYFWGKIPSNNNLKISKKTKKIISVTLIAILISGILLYLVPNIQKSMALDSLDYVNYYYGWGFNPPENWVGGTVNQGGDSPSAYARFHPPGDNVSNDVWLDIYGGPIGKSPNLEKLAQERLNDIQKYLLNNTKNFSLISYGKRLINGMEAYEIVYYWESVSENNSNVTKNKQKEIYVAKGETLVCVVFYVYHSEYYDLYDSVVEKSLSSFTIS